jgi:hypothetical protein
MRYPLTLKHPTTKKLEAIPVQIARRQSSGDSASPAAEVESAPILCCYKNQTSKIQIIRSVEQQGPHWHLERVVFPGQRLLFKAPPHSRVHVFSSNPADTLVDDTVLCDRIQVQEE